MNILGKWGTFIVVPQAVLGGAAYALMAAQEGINNGTALAFALTVAAAVAIILIILAILSDRVVGVATATASLAMILAAFCALSGILVFAGLLFFLGLSLIKLADMLLKSG